MILFKAAVIPVLIHPESAAKNKEHGACVLCWAGLTVVQLEAHPVYRHAARGGDRGVHSTNRPGLLANGGRGHSCRRGAVVGALQHDKSI